MPLRGLSCPPDSANVKLHEAMPTDFAVYYLTQPLGLIFQAGLIAIPLLFLRFSFPAAFAPLGYRRLLSAHLSVAVGVFVLAAYSAFD
jgi:hypothetical protein